MCPAIKITVSLNAELKVYKTAPHASPSLRSLGMQEVTAETDFALVDTASMSAVTFGVRSHTWAFLLTCTSRRMPKLQETTASLRML